MLELQSVSATEVSIGGVAQQAKNEDDSSCDTNCKLAKVHIIISQYMSLKDSNRFGITEADQ